MNSGEWIGQLSGLGAGIDSFFEYLLKVIFSPIAQKPTFSLELHSLR